jgi:hypothetical protein
MMPLSVCSNAARPCWPAPAFDQPAQQVFTILHQPILNEATIVGVAGKRDLL